MGQMYRLLITSNLNFSSDLRFIYDLTILLFIPPSFGGAGGGYSFGGAGGGCYLRFSNLAIYSAVANSSLFILHSSLAKHSSLFT